MYYMQHKNNYSHQKAKKRNLHATGIDHALSLFSFIEVNENNSSNKHISSFMICFYRLEKNSETKSILTAG